MAGSAAWLQDSTEDAAALHAKVTGPGGAGIQRIAELDERAVRAAFVTALTRTTRTDSNHIPDPRILAQPARSLLTEGHDLWSWWLAVAIDCGSLPLAYQSRWRC